MRQVDAYILATDLMREHGLIQQGWKFDFDKAVRRFGCCQHSKKKITLSRKLTELNSEAEVKDTILHEIAHALVGSKHGHDYIWKAMARKIGCSGNRCYQQHEVVVPVMKYSATCPVCGNVSQRTKQPPRHRKTSCGKCSNRFDPARILKYDLNPAWIEEQQRRELSIRRYGIAI